MDKEQSRVDIWLPADVFAAAEEEAARQGRTLNEYLVRLVEADVLKDAIRPTGNFAVIDGRFSLNKD